MPAVPAGRAGAIGRPAIAGVLLLFLAACSGSPSGTPLPVPSGAVVIRAVDSKWQPSTVELPSSAGFTLYFDNADTLPHNLVFLGADGSRPFGGDVFTGPAQKVYEVPALPAGTYKLHCDVHPEMNGTLTVP